MKSPLERLKIGNGNFVIDALKNDLQDSSQLI